MKKIKIILLAALMQSILLYGQKNFDDIISLLNSGLYDEAIEEIKRKDTNNEMLYAIAFVGKKDFVSAKNILEKNYENVKDNTVANYLLALISEEEKDFISAERYWKIVFRQTNNKNVRALAKKHIEVLKLLIK